MISKWQTNELSRNTFVSRVPPPTRPRATINSRISRELFTFIAWKSCLHMHFFFSKDFQRFTFFMLNTITNCRKYSQWAWDILQKSIQKARSRLQAYKYTHVTFLPGDVLFSTNQKVFSNIKTTAKFSKESSSLFYHRLFSSRMLHKLHISIWHFISNKRIGQSLEFVKCIKQMK